MIDDCEGCGIMMEEFIQFQEEGLHFAWHEEYYPFDKNKHLIGYMVDDEGNVIVS